MQDDEKLASDTSDEDLELSKGTIEDLDTPDETAEGAKGGASRGCKI